MPKISVPFYFGLGSRYSYLAATQLAAIEARCGCRFDWLPLQSGALIRRANGGLSPFHDGNPSGQYDWGFRQRDAEAWARHYGVPYREPAEFRADPDDLAKACWAAQREDKLQVMAERLFQAIFVAGLVITREVLATLADEIGLSGAALVEALDAPEIVGRHEAVLSQALAAGAFGVPSFIVAGELYWGNDRLPLVEAALTTGEPG